MKGLSRHKLLFGFLGILSIGVVAMVSPVNAELSSAGIVTAIGNDWISIDEGFHFWESDGDSIISVVLEQECTSLVETIIFQNRIYATNWSPYQVRIQVADDEDVLGFDPYSASSYTTDVFWSLLDPVTNAAGALRVADISDVSKKYFLIEFLNRLSGAIPPSGRVIVGDFFVTPTKCDLETENAALQADLAACEAELGTFNEIFYLPPGIERAQGSLSKNPNAVKVQGKLVP